LYSKEQDHLAKMIAYYLIQNCCKCDYDHYKVLSVIMTVLLHFTTHE